MSDPFIAHSEISNEIYIICGRNKYPVTEQVIRAMKATGRLDERPKGHWIEEPGNIPHCSVCGTYSDDADREDGGFYCTHCGSLMVDTQDEDQ